MAAHPIRWTTLGAVALALPAAGRAPITMRYRIDQTLTQEADAPGQGKQTLSFSTSSFVKVTLTDSAGGKAMRVEVDSMRGDSAAPIPAAVFDSARGAVFQGFVSREGRPSPLASAGSNPASAAQIQGLVSDFYPWVRAGFKVGESWSDTSIVVSGEAPDTVVLRRVNRYRTAASETHRGRPAVRVAVEYATEVAGSQPTAAGSARIQGTGGGQGSYLVSADGRYLGGEWELNSSLTLAGAFAPEPVPLTLRQTTRVAPLP